MSDFVVWVQYVGPVLSGVFVMFKYFVNDIKEDISEVKKTAMRAHSRIDSHLENH